MFSVIFEVHPAEGKRDEYLGHAGELKPVIQTIDGFIDNERFGSRTRPGWMLSLSTWRNEKALIRWRTESRHHLIQEKGRAAVFSDYHLRVGEVVTDTHPPMPLREERFDTTEAGASKFCTVTELVPLDGHELPDGDALLQATGLCPGMSGLHEVAVYDSIYQPGKVLVLASWVEPEAADALRIGGIPGTRSVRRRAVRVIRDYGMFDRRETPQYYPDVARRS